MAERTKKRKVRLSQCLIVKNEEANIERALSWGRDIVFEQIVVDTGSTDRTVELAEKMGAKIFHFQWINDFAAAKNYAIEQAKGNWIAFLDADEYFLPDHAAKLLPFLEALHYKKPLVVATEWLNLDDQGRLFCGGTQMRIFRNMPGLRYSGVIHEALLYHQQKLYAEHLEDACSELSILHEGYKKSVAGEGQKGQRNRPLIMKELEKSPDSADLMGYLADCYWVEKEPELALEWYEKAVAAMGPGPVPIGITNNRYATTFSNLLYMLANRGREEHMMEVYQFAIEKVPKDGDFDHIVGKYFAHVNNFKSAAYHLERALELLAQFGDNSMAANLTGDLPGTWELLAVSHFNNGNLDICVKYCVNLLKANKYIMATLVVMLRAFMENQDPADGVARFLGSLYDFDILKDRLFVLKASMQVSYHGLTGILRDSLSPEQRDHFDRAMAGAQDGA